MGFTFHTKAETLEDLAKGLISARILPLRHFSVAEWRADPAAVLAELSRESWGGGPLIVRSSAAGEDSVAGSEAGKYLSIQGVEPSALAEAIERVAASYHSDERVAQGDRVLVQPMLADVTLSGVAFTRDPSTGAPTLVVNACAGGNTAAVTGGGAEASWCHHHWLDGPEAIAPTIKALTALARELIVLCGTDALDIEFAVTAVGALYLLQVRPLLLAAGAVDRTTHGERLHAIIHRVAEAMQPHPFLHGSRTVFGIMPDWNPAEMIGIRPSPLALTLYRELITDSIWAYQRHNYGYKNLRSFPLLISFHGLPYIDVRVSFNSFLPRDLDGAVSERLVDYYIERLLARPALHDKVEFEIVFSAYTFDLDQRLAALADYGFNSAEIATLTDELRRLTNRIINRQTGLWQSDSQKLVVLEERRDRLLASDLAPAEKIYWLLEDCKRYGTLPFAGLARAGFIAVQILRSLVVVGVLTADEMAAFMRGLDTVGTELAEDAARLDREAFLDKYGHLRPGTYDIRSPRYDEAPDLYGIGLSPGSTVPSLGQFSLSLRQIRRIEALLREHGLETDVVGLFDFLQAAIEGREKAKFIFTRNLSDALALLTDLGGKLGFGRDDLAYADIAVIREMRASSEPVEALLARSIAAGRERHAVTRSLTLPSVITAPSDVWSFRMQDSEPNFITLGQVRAEVRGASEGGLHDHIVCIPSADPGYDWIFSQGIAGLITAFGGANSHMAIRAAELGIPAVIGAGEMNFRRWSAARMLAIDCANRKVEILR